MAEARGRARRLQNEPRTFVVPESKAVLKEKWRHAERTKHPI